MERLFEKIYNETHIVKLNELTAEFIKTKIKRAIENGNGVAVADTDFNACPIVLQLEMGVD